MDIKNNQGAKTIAKVIGVSLVAIPIMGIAFASFQTTNPVPNLEIVYKNSIEAVKRDRETCIQTEIALAKAKLANHYSGVAKLENTDELAKKAEGQGLSCSNL